ncbi:unnamed protein product [Ceratitis capitata]|uniref:(Mediterranean fruit fly) hypothetical protein n=1 Tax=Ceratitis capitata TaxID=7213 RepID=A0A811TZK2_CERCA|nr:unnamed protein product [Ceratitis capitata]
MVNCVNNKFTVYLNIQQFTGRTPFFNVSVPTCRNATVLSRFGYGGGGGGGGGSVITVDRRPSIIQLFIHLYL